MNSLGSIEVGQVVRYNYYGETFMGVVKSIRQMTTAWDLYQIRFDNHMITVNEFGNGVSYNGYSTAIVKCNDTPETRAAMEIIKVALGDEPEHASIYKSIAATMAISTDAS